MKSRLLSKKPVIVLMIIISIFAGCKKKSYSYPKNVIVNGEFEGDLKSPWICTGQVDLIGENNTNGNRYVRLTSVRDKKVEIRQDIKGVFCDFEMILRGKVCTRGMVVARACVSVHDDNASMDHAPYGYVGGTGVGSYETGGKWEDFNLKGVMEGQATSLSVTLYTKLGNEGDYALYDDITLEVKPIR